MAFRPTGPPGVLDFLRVDLAGDTFVVYQLRKTDLLPHLVHKSGQPALTDVLPISLADAETIAGQPIQLSLLDYEQRAKQIVDLLAEFAEAVAHELQRRR